MTFYDFITYILVIAAGYGMGWAIMHRPPLKTPPPTYVPGDKIDLTKRRKKH